MANSILSPNILSALELNELINKTISYPPQLYWNTSLKRLERTNPCFRLGISWVANVVIPISICSCIYVLLDGFSHRGKYPVDQILRTTIPLVFALTTSASNYLLSIHKETICEAVNRLYYFECKVRDQRGKNT